MCIFVCPSFICFFSCFATDLLLLLYNVKHLHAATPKCMPHFVRCQLPPTPAPRSNRNSEIPLCSWPLFAFAFMCGANSSCHAFGARPASECKSQWKYFALPRNGTSTWPPAASYHQVACTRATQLSAPSVIPISHRTRARSWPGKVLPICQAQALPEAEQDGRPLFSAKFSVKQCKGDFKGKINLSNWNHFIKVSKSMQ